MGLPATRATNNRAGAGKLLTLVASLCLIAPAVFASTTDSKTSTPEVPAAKVAMAETPLSVWSFCERATVATEMAQRLPRAILFSVAMVESGRYNKATKKTRPWPWTINAEGQSFYFKTKREAVAAARQLMKDGVRSFDVGCMQINMRYHPNAFTDLEAAFDPIINVAYSAEFLKRLHSKSNSWPEAIAAYHSQTKTRSQPYFARVIDVWTDQHERISELAHVLREQAKAQVALQLRHTQEDPIYIAPVETAPAVVTPVVAMVRPAPKVLGTDYVSQVREASGGNVGLRLSIADGEFSTGNNMSAQIAPHVIPSRPAVRGTATLVADASPTL
tara:strand:- start:4124 stop:5119 length:996 start_codon:yes stop_codon:yes gene_type:complete